MRIINAAIIIEIFVFIYFFIHQFQFPEGPVQHCACPPSSCQLLWCCECVSTQLLWPRTSLPKRGLTFRLFPWSEFVWASLPVVACVNFAASIPGQSPLYPPFSEWTSPACAAFPANAIAPRSIPALSMDAFEIFPSSFKRKELIFCLISNFITLRLN